MEAAMKRPKFMRERNTDWVKELQERVRSAVRSSDKRVKRKMHIKAALMAGVYLTAYFGMLFFSESLAAMFSWFALLGVVLIVLFLNTAHDLAHNTFLKSKKWNQRFMYLFDFLGDDHVIWKTRHVVYHHSYSNVQHWDKDIRQSKMVRILPNAVYRNFHKYQHVYMPVLYLFYTIHVSFIRDFYDMFHKNGLMKTHGAAKERKIARFILFKIINLTHLLVIPMLVVPQAWYWVFAGFVVMHFAGSMVAVVNLVSAHVGEDAVFVKENDDNVIEHSWREHQLITTTDFATQSKLVTYLTGGFNHHVAHHLFPSISHGHYEKITAIIVELDKKYGLDYKSLSLSKALITHWHLLRNNSVKPGEVFAE